MHKNVILMQTHDFDAKHLLFLPSGVCFESKWMILMQKNVMFCPAERALRANGWFLRKTNVLLHKKTLFYAKNTIFDANISTILGKNWYSALSIWD